MYKPIKCVPVPIPTMLLSLITLFIGIEISNYSILLFSEKNGVMFSGPILTL
jgi:hypothetical protein